MQSEARRSERELTHLRRSLLSWYEKHRRDLPWRNTRDPYSVWVSEIMLQQTRVAVIIPRYRQFLERFPSVQELALASEAAVLAEWSGLGYYHRARNLHAAAKIIVGEGKFPQNAQQWRTLPGIGRYTSAAIASIALNEPIAVLDGNIERVLRRLDRRLHTEHESWSAAQHLLDRQRPGDFNQAMMELGATICQPAEPRCPDCPVREFCLTRGRGESVSKKPPQQKREISYALARRNGSVRLVRRSQTASLMPGMWELPEAAANSSGELLFLLKHSITVTDYSVRVLKCANVQLRRGAWIKVAGLNSIPLTGLARKILREASIIQ